MLVKSQGLRTPKRARELLNYIQKGTPHPAWAIHQNLPGTGIRQMVAAFDENEKALPNRKNRVWRYHVMLSFHPDDSSVLTPEMERDLTLKFLELRGPGALAYAQPHTDRPHRHIHICLSNNEVQSRRSLRLSKAKFAEIKQELERYQKTQYPQLKHSLVMERTKEKRSAVQMKPQEYILYHLNEGLQQYVSLDHLEAHLAKYDLMVYRRGGKWRGMKYGGKKYRFSTLGVEHAINVLERMDEVQRLRERTTLEREHDREK